MVNVATEEDAARSSDKARAGGPWLARYGPWALITGASSGIGCAIAFELAAVGLDVVLTSRRPERLNEVADEIVRSWGVQTRVIVADLGTSEGLHHVADACAELDIGLLVAAAGFGTSGDFLGADVATEADLLDVNCRAVMMQTLHFGRRLAQRGRGGIILLGSIVGGQGVSGAVHYAATKAYVQSLGEGLHLELASHGVDVLVSAPGPVHSGFAQRADMRMGAALDPAVVARATVRALGRSGTVVPGALSKMMTYSLVLLPRWVRSRILGRVMHGMTRHQHSLAD